MESNVSTVRESGIEKVVQVEAAATPLWEEYFCPTSFCEMDLLLARRTPANLEVWQVTDASDGAPWLVAADVPVCPWCGAPLLSAEALKDVIGAFATDLQ